MKNKRALLKRCIRIQHEAIFHIKQHQQKNGCFISISSSDVNFKQNKIYHTTFFAAQILYNLRNINDSVSVHIKKKAASFLMREKSNHWSWNYWSKKSPEFRDKPYPDDLDDTFCALSALHSYDPTIIDGTALASIVQLLTFTEENEGGPYRTWLVPSNANTDWLDIDVAVNSNIAYFLKKQEIFLDAIELFIEKIIRSKNYYSPYYPNSLPVIYFISRFYNKPHKDKIIAYIKSLQEPNGSWGNQLNTALALSSLINFGDSSINVDQGIVALCHETVFKPHPFCIDPSTDQRVHYAGASSLTASYVTDAVSLYIDMSSKAISIPKQRESELIKKIIDTINARINEFPKDFKVHCKHLLHKILKNDSRNEILLLPYYFASSCALDDVPIKTIIKLGAASMWGWMAYTFYDNVLDTDSEISTFLVGNICLREVTLIYGTLLSDKQIGFFKDIMDRIDYANHWENTHLRIQSKKNLKQTTRKAMLVSKSFGHALAPLTLLILSGYHQNSPKFKNTEAFFKHYISARQLGDDAHDWEDDLRKNYLNSASINFTQKLTSLTPQKLQRLQKHFWNKIIDRVSSEILHHVSHARMHLHRLELRDASFFESLLVRHETTARIALKERNTMNTFMKAYRQ